MTLSVNAGSIPSELKRLDQWVLWRYEQRDGRATKIPFSINGQQAKANSRSTWASFDAVYKLLCDHPKRYNGIGFVFAKDDNYVGIDLDGVLDPETGEQLPIAAEIIQTLNGYTEITPSGAGFHIIIKGFLPDGGWRRKKIRHLRPLGGKPAVEVEMYDRNRYFTVTGNTV